MWLIEERLFTVREAAEYLTVCPKTVYALIGDGELDVLKIGSRYKIPAESLSKYVESKRIS
jgi:excisionase family DNA binding protein